MNRITMPHQGVLTTTCGTPPPISTNIPAPQRDIIESSLRRAGAKPEGWVRMKKETSPVGGGTQSSTLQSRQGRLIVARHVAESGVPG